MDHPVYHVVRNAAGRELLEHGSPLFPCSAYDRRMSQFAAGRIAAHWHPDLEMFLLLEGDAHVTLAGREYDLSPGDGYFANSGVLHGITCPDGTDCHYHSMVFAPSIVAGAPGSAFDLLYVRPFTEQGGAAWIFRGTNDADRALLDTFREAFAACEDGGDGYEFIVRERLSRILLTLRDRTPTDPGERDSVQERRLKQMISWLDAHYAEPVSVGELADATGICVRECQRTFARALHQSPMTYLLHRRISAAADLLVGGELPVADIAVRCGFDSPAYFARQFKAVTGMSPREYRKRHTAGPVEGRGKSTAASV
ncbi:MAG: AraC family transcriptional regulator [Bifidobacterium sp.]|nr:AraC family transcriptional regulator [Bifidobacterium sp.]